LFGFGGFLADYEFLVEKELQEDSGILLQGTIVAFA
jgi:hypothetical protein